MGTSMFKREGDLCSGEFMQVGGLREGELGEGELRRSCRRLDRRRLGLMNFGEGGGIEEISRDGEWVSEGSERKVGRGESERCGREVGEREDVGKVFSLGRRVVSVGGGEWDLAEVADGGG